jgi:hypothetical protein
VPIFGMLGCFGGKNKSVGDVITGLPPTLASNGNEFEAYGRDDKPQECATSERHAEELI